MADRRVDTIPASLLSVDLGHETITDAASWQVTRSLSGGGLPGQARAVSGSSVGSGSITLPDRTGASPWSATPPMPGGSAIIQAMHDAEVPMEGGPLDWRPVASMRVRSVGAGSLLSGARDVEIEDRTPQGPVTIPASTSSDCTDAAGVVDWIARQAGYYATRPPSGTTILSLPLCGSLWAERGRSATSTIGDGARYGEHQGRIMLTDSSVDAYLADAAMPTHVLVGFTAYAPQFGDDVNIFLQSSTGRTLGIQVATGLVRITTTGGGTTSLGPPGLPPLARIEVVYGAGRASVYVDRQWVGEQNPVGPALEDLSSVTIGVSGGAMVSGVSIDARSTPLDYFTPTARIGTAASLLTMVMPQAGDAWATVQQIAASTLGAAWIDESGHLVYRGRDAMRGGEVAVDFATGKPVVVDVLDDAEDLPWSLSIDDVADRVTVTYTSPVEQSSAGGTLGVWESTDMVTVRAGQTVTIEQDLELAADSLEAWLPVWSTERGPSQGSRWNAFPNSDGTGTQPADTAIVVTSTMLTPTRLRLQVRNTSAGTLYVTQLTVRSRYIVTPGEPRTLSAGATEEAARTPLSVDLGAWVQDDDTAQEILAWLAGTTSAPLPTIGPVRVAADSERRLGDTVLVRLRSGVLGPDGQPVAAWTVKALISGISQSAAPGEYQQTYTLTALNATLADLARYLTAEGVTTLGDLATHWTALLGPSATLGDIAEWITPGGLYS